MKKILLNALLTCVSLSFAQSGAYAATKEHTAREKNKEHLRCIAKKLQAKYYNPDQYMLPKKCKLRRTLERLFSHPKVIQDNYWFTKAGFKTKFFRVRGSLRVASHPQLKGYLIKMFLESEAREKMWDRQRTLITRAGVAAELRELIKKNKLRKIKVPKKYLFVLPPAAKTRIKTYVLVVQDMKLVKMEKSKKAWKKIASKRVLRELYCVLNHGYASLAIDQNIARTKNGKFACIDTEYPRRTFDLKRVERFFSRSNKLYWESLIDHEKVHKDRGVNW